MTWQNETSELSSKFAYLLESEAFSDVTLIVGEKPEERRFNVHRLVLSIYSEVFEAMFYGKLAKDDKEVTFSDDDPDTFELMIRYIYTGNISPESPREAMNLLLLSNKYFINRIKLQCIDYLTKNISSDLVIEVYEVATEMGEHRLRLECWKYIRFNTSQVLNNESFKLAAPSVLLGILGSAGLNIDSEIELYNAVKRWGMSRCKRRGESVTGSNVRAEIKALLHVIRFLAMSPEHFADGPATDDIFSPEEKLSILRNIISPEVKSLPKEFSSAKNERKRISPKYKYFYVCCERSRVISSSTEKLLLFSQAIVFPCFDAYVYGVSLFLSKEKLGVRLPSTKCFLSIRNTNKNYKTERQNLVLRQRGEECFIRLDEPVYISSGEICEIKLNVSHTEDFLYYCSGNCKPPSSTYVKILCDNVDNGDNFHFHKFLVWDLPRRVVSDKV